MFTNDEFIKKGYVNDGFNNLALKDPKTGFTTHCIYNTTKGAAVRFTADTCYEIDYYGKVTKTHDVKGKTFKVTDFYTRYILSCCTERPYGAVDLKGEDGTIIRGVSVRDIELVL